MEKNYCINLNLYPFVNKKTVEAIIFDWYGKIIADNGSMIRFTTKYDDCATNIFSVVSLIDKQNFFNKYGYANKSYEDCNAETLR